MTKKYAFKNLLVGFGAVTAIAAPVVLAVSCTGSPAKPLDTSKTISLNNAPEGTWHELFHKSGRSLPSVGLKLGVNAGGQALVFTWTAADSAAKVPTDYLAGNASQSEMLAYLANRFATFPGVKASDVFSSFGLQGTVHAFGSMPTVSTEGMPTTGVEVDANGVQTPTIVINGKSGWHELFHESGYSLPEAGTKIQLPIGAWKKLGNVSENEEPEDDFYIGSDRGTPIYMIPADSTGKLLEITWTSDDNNSAVAQGYVAQTLEHAQSDMVEYVQNRFIIANPMYATQIEAAFANSALVGGHTILSDLGHVTERTAVSVFDIQGDDVTGDITITDNISALWHAAFAFTGQATGTPPKWGHSGRSLPIVGDTFKWDDTHEYVWTARDNAILAGYLTFDMTQNDVVQYVAGKVAHGDMDIAKQILWHVSDATGDHHEATGGQSPADAAGIGERPITVTINGEAGFHELFFRDEQYSQPPVDSVINLPIGDWKQQTTPIYGTDKILGNADDVTVPAGLYYVGESRGVQYYVEPTVEATDAEAKIISYTWTEDDFNSSVIQGYLGHSKTQGDVVNYLQSRMISENPNESTGIEAAFEKFGGGHTIQVALGNIQARTAVATFNLETKSVSGGLTSATGKIEDVWHLAFTPTQTVGAHSGRTLPIAGDKFVYGTHTYVWTAQDNQNLATFLTNGMAENAVVLYVADKVAGTAGRRDQVVYDAIIDGFTRGHHADGDVNLNAFIDGIDLTFVKDATHTDPEVGLWHILGRDRTMLRAGTILKVTVNGDELTHTLTQTEVNAAPRDAAGFEEYIANLFVDATHSQAQILKAFGFSGQEHGMGDEHAA